MVTLSFTLFPPVDQRAFSDVTVPGNGHIIPRMRPIVKASSVFWYRSTAWGNSMKAGQGKASGE
jgi:hypothetical protein